MNNNLITSPTIVMLVALTIAIAMSSINIGRTEPGYAQPTFDGPSSPTSSPDTGSSTEAGTSDDGETFQQFMDCLFGGEVSEEDISNALDGSSESTPLNKKSEIALPLCTILTVPLIPQLKLGAVQQMSQKLRVTMKERVMTMEITVPTAEHQKTMMDLIRTTSAE